MSGGVDSSVAALLLKEEGYEVVGVTMKLWGGVSDVGCCSVSDVDDARRVADLIDIPHFVFNFGDEFQADVVDPYVASYQKGETPNPCIECNRKIKFQMLTDRARVLGFDAVATGHHARIVTDEKNTPWLTRGVDFQKDQSYVLNMLTLKDLQYTMFPIGHLTKDEVRTIAADNNLRIAQKPDSYEVCFIKKSDGREKFLADRILPTPAQVVDTSGELLGSVPSIEMLTIGQRKGINLKSKTQKSKTLEPNYVLSIDMPIDMSINTKPTAKVTLGKKADLLTKTQEIRNLALREGINPLKKPLEVQTSAHGKTTAAILVNNKTPKLLINWEIPQKRVAPGQSLVFYYSDIVVGFAFAA